MSDYTKVLPNNKEVLERDEKWKLLFEKYENCGDCEEDGYDIGDLIACGEVEDEELEELFVDEEEAVESSDEDVKSKENVKDLVVYSNKPKTVQDLEKIYDPEFIKGLKRAFDRRCTELDGLNLTFWKRSKTHEGFNESNIKTPNFEASTRSFFRTSEQVCHSAKKSQDESPPQFKMPHPLNFNRDSRQFGNYLPNMNATNNYEQNPRFPFQIDELMNGSQKINIRIREMHYDLSVDGRDITGLFIPNCNSTYAVPGLGNLTINNTMPNIENIQKVQPAITYEVDQMRAEPTEKVNDKVELNVSNVESLNSSIVDNFDGINIADSSRDEYTSKGKKTGKKTGQKKKHRKKNYKPKQKVVKSKKEVKEIIPVDTLTPISEKLELSYSDVVKLSPKNIVKQTRSSKAVNEPKKQVEQQKTKKNTQEVFKSYRRIIDPDTSTEEISVKPEAPKASKNDEKKFKEQKPEAPKAPRNDENLKEAPKVSKNDEKLKQQKFEVQKACKNDEKFKQEKTEAPKAPKNDEKLSQQKIEEKKVCVVDKKPKVQQKSKNNAKTSTKSKKEQQPETSSKNKVEPTKKQDSVKKENELELQYDENGKPFRNIKGFIVRYEENNSDSDSSEDDTEFFRRIHAEIRKKKI